MSKLGGRVEWGEEFDGMEKGCCNTVLQFDGILLVISNSERNRGKDSQPPSCW